MWFLILGLTLAALKFFEIWVGPSLSWWYVIAPFALAAAWWSFADWSGYTKRRAIEREEALKEERIERQRSQLGMLSSRTNRRRNGY